MVKSNLVTLGVVLGTIGLLLIGGAYLAFTDASESFDESLDDSDAGCIWGICWFLPGGSFGCGSCMLGILLVILVVPILFGGFLSGLVGIWSVPERVVVVAPLPPPEPPAKPDVVDDEFAEIERELDSLED